MTATSVWWADLDVAPALVEQLGGILSAEEKERAGRYRHDRDRRRFVMGRGIARTVLAGVAGVAPPALRLAVGPHGKLEVRGAATPAVEFSMSRSAGTLLLAVSRDARIGVDVEVIRPDIDIDRIATRFFSACEKRALADLDPALRLRAGFACWTRKEAYLKGLGVGLTAGLDGFSVSVHPNGPVGLTGSFPSAEQLRRWSIAALDVGPDAVAALAVERAGALLERSIPRPVRLVPPYDPS